MGQNNVDAQLERMRYLMDYGVKQPVNESKCIEYHTEAANGTVYGIIKEGQMYYIKTTEKGKEKIKESYQYINGFDHRNENGYRSYNEATKQLELKLMALNESMGVHRDVSTVDYKAREKEMLNLTEEARKELNRMHMIFENSGKIGKYTMEDPESKGKATDPEKQGQPFEDNAKAELDKDMKKTGTVDNATDNTEVKGAEEDLTSDKMKTKKVDSAKKPTDAHCDLEGENVAEKNPSGAKAVKMNESIDNNDLVGFGADGEMDDTPEVTDVEDEMGDNVAEPMADNSSDVTPNDFNSDDEAQLEAQLSDNSAETDQEPDALDEFDSLLEELESQLNDAQINNEEQPVNEGSDAVICGDNDVLMGKTVDAKSIAIENSPVKDNEKKCSDSCCGEKVLTGPTSDSKTSETMKRLKESREKIINKVCDALINESKLTEEEMMKKVISDEVKKQLNVWGQHPRYRKEPMTMPNNTEVTTDSQDKDWNDDSANGNQAYGQKIGDSAPFDLIVDKVTKQLKENLLRKKK